MLILLKLFLIVPPPSSFHNPGFFFLNKIMVILMSILIQNNWFISNCNNIRFLTIKPQNIFYCLRFYKISVLNNLFTSVRTFIFTIRIHGQQVLTSVLLLIELFWWMLMFTPVPHFEFQRIQGSLHQSCPNR